MIVAHELGLAGRFTLSRSVASMSAPNPDIMADNPLNKIPTLVRDDGTAMYDSRVICEYLDSLDELGRFFPPSGESRWQALTWQALGDGALDVLILWRNERDKAQQMQSAQWLAAFALKTTTALDVLEAAVPALTAAPFGIGHVAIGCMLSYADFRFGELGWRVARPALARWHEGFCARPSARSTEISDA